MNCPNCQTDVKITEQNFGSLFTCPSCQAAYFINFEGQPEFSNEPIEYPAEVAPVQEISPEEAPVEMAPLDISYQEEQSASNYTSEQSFEQPLADQPVDIQAEPLNDFSSPINPFENPILDEQAPVSDGGLSSFGAVAQEIADFGNSDTQVAALNYDLKISGLDTIEILKLFKEAIEDQRFGWEINEMMRSVRNGEILIEKLNPVKAYILSKRLQFIDVEKKWTQNALS